MANRWIVPPPLDRLISSVPAGFRTEAMAARPRVRELRRELTLVNREIQNVGRAVARGDFASLERALAAAELRRATLQAELAQLDGSQHPSVVQLTPATLERHLQGMTEKLRSGQSGKVREAIQQSMARILVGVDGSLTIEPKPGGILRPEKNIAQLECRDDWALREPSTLSVAGRQWKLIIAP